MCFDWNYSRAESLDKKASDNKVSAINLTLIQCIAYKQMLTFEQAAL